MIPRAAPTPVASSPKTPRRVLALPLRGPVRHIAGFTILEMLVAMAMFSVLGVAVVSLLSQGLNLFSEGTADTSMQDRLQAILPPIREDLAAMKPVETPEVPPPPPPAIVDPNALPFTTEPVPPAIRLRSGTIKLTDLPADQAVPLPYVAFVRSNAREAEDPILRDAGTAGASSGVPLRSYDPSAVDSGTTGNLLAPGGLLEVVWIAVPDDPEQPGILTLYRLFRAPVGGPKTLLDPVNFDSLAKIRAAGRPVHEGVLHFGVTFRNVFARSWEDGVGRGSVDDGEPYVGRVWDSTRALDPKFPLVSRDPKGSVENVRDDVFPSMVRLEVVLATPGPFGFGRGETTLAAGMGREERRALLGNVDLLYKPGPDERWLKVGTEWMSTTLSGVDYAGRAVVVTRAGRGSAAVEHKEGDPVYVGQGVSVDVPLLFKDRYARRR